MRNEFATQNFSPNEGPKVSDLLIVIKDRCFPQRGALRAAMCLIKVTGIGARLKYCQKAVVGVIGTPPATSPYVRPAIAQCPQF